VSYLLPPAGSRNRLLRLPVVRGVVALYESLSLGIKALGISANIGLEGSEEAGSATAATADESGAVTTTAADSAAGMASAVDAATGDATPEASLTPVAEGVLGSTGPEETAFGWKELAVTVVVSVGLAVALFVVVPLVVVKQFEETFANPFLFNLVEGLIRIAIFILYIVGISLIPDLRKVFQYHGAEHKVIHAYESCGRPDADHAKGFSTMHPRCGTGFLLLVMIIAVFVFAIVGKPSVPYLVLSRIVGIPLIVGIAYEIGIKWLGKHPNGLIARILLWPGIQLQRLTTREPTPDQLEVAAAALDEVMRMDEVAEQA